MDSNQSGQPNTMQDLLESSNECCQVCQQKFLLLFQKMDVILRQQQKSSEITARTINVINKFLDAWASGEMELVQMDGQVQSTTHEESGAPTRKMSMHSNYNSVVGDLRGVVKDLTVIRDQVSENNADTSLTPFITLQKKQNLSPTSFITLQEQQNLQNSSGMQELGFRETIPQSMVRLPLQQNNFQIINNINNNTPVEVTQSINILPTVELSGQSNYDELKKQEEMRQIDKKRRFYKNKYNYLKMGRNSKPNNLNNATVNALVNFETGERICIPEHNFKIIKKPIIFKDVKILCRRYDD